MAHTGVVTTRSAPAWIGPLGRVSLPVLRRPLLADALLALAVLLTVVPHAVQAGSQPRADAVLVSVALVVPLVWRRRAPVAVFAAVCVVAFLQWLFAGPEFADLALLIAFYTVCATQSPRRSVLAAAVLEGGVVLAVVRFHAEHSDYLLAIVFLSGLVTAAGVLGANVRVRRAYLAEVEQRAARLEFERDQQAQLAVAGERTRIAREMHDIIAHNLSVMIALTDGAAFTVASDPGRAAAAMAEASGAGRRALSEMRRVLGVLRADSGTAELAPTPGLADLDEVLQTIRRTGLRARLTCDGPVSALPASLQLSIYRLVQESLTNTVKHARGASRLDVMVRRGPDWVEVTVTDDGAPAGALSAEHAFSHGIIGMRERAALHAGHVEVGPTPTGWRVRARFPVPAGDAALVEARRG